MVSIPAHFDDVIAGAAAGVVGTVLGFPLDAIKSRMQIHSSRSIGWVLRSIYAEEGVRSFYRGLASPLVALVLLNSMNFTLYSRFRDILGRRPEPITPPITSSGPVIGVPTAIFPAFDWRVVLAGAAVGPFAGMISTPFEYLKLQMQMQFNRAQVAAAGAQAEAPVHYRSTVHACGSILRSHGVGQLYTGHAVNAAREVVFLGTYFGVYEHTKQAIVGMFSSMSNGSSGALSSVAIPVAGGVSGAIGWLVSYPLDCIKGNVQGRPLGVGSDPTPSVRTIAGEILRTRGVLGLYSGVSLSLLRAFIVSASRFSCYEGVIWALRRD